MPVSFIHPKLMEHLSRYSGGVATPFPNLITRQTMVRTYDPNTNEPIDTPTSDPLLQNVAAYIEPVDSRQEVRRADQTVVENGWNISLAGFYHIDVDDTVFDELGNVYNVLHVSQDAFKTQTTLIAEIINTEVETG